MLAAVLVTGMVSAIWLGQSSPVVGSQVWVEDYRDGLRSELAKGDLTAAIAAYRRVMVSGAPPAYVEGARYRLANVLIRAGREDEAKRVLHDLTCKLPESAPLRGEVNRRLEQVAARLEDRTEYWKRQLEMATRMREPGRLKDAASYLAHDEGFDGVASLLEAYGRLHPGDSLRGMMMRYLAESESPEVIGVIRNALHDADAEVAAQAALAASWLDDAASTPTLIDMLSAPDSRMRGSAARALQKMRSLPAVDSLIRVASSDTDKGVRAMAVEALQCIGTPQALDAVSKYGEGEPAKDCGCDFSRWYRETRVGDDRAQSTFRAPQDDAPAGSAPRIGVVVSAMTHHGPSCAELDQPYARQVRKAWTLQRAGFDVCLLVEPEVEADPEAEMLREVFKPAAAVHPLGTWPACDVVVMDQLHHLPAAVVRAIKAYGEQGGRVVVCGATCGGHCGDRITWRGIVGVRRPHTHRFQAEALRLSWAAGSDLPLRPTVASDDWIARRKGTFFSHDTLGGQVLAEFDSPKIWAIKTQSLGLGRAMALNWDIGMNLQGTRDEDELFCRCVDVMLDDPSRFGSPLFKMMHHLRWGRLTEARASITPEAFASMARDRQIETIVHLLQLYGRENNIPAGLAVTGALSEQSDLTSGDLVAMAVASASLPRLQLGSPTTGEPIWWLDVPDWMMDGQELPLWLAGVRQMPAPVSVRVGLPVGRRGRLRVSATDADIKSLQGPVEEAGQKISATLCEATCKPAKGYESWVEVAMEARTWLARVQVEMLPE